MNELLSSPIAWLVMALVAFIGGGAVPWQKVWDYLKSLLGTPSAPGPGPHPPTDPVRLEEVVTHFLVVKKHCDHCPADVQQALKTVWGHLADAHPHMPEVNK